jgi:hypothetical protein
LFNEEEVIRDVRELYVHKAISFMVDFDRVQDVDLFYKNNLPHYCAKTYVKNMPLSGISKFFFSELITMPVE